MNPQVPTTCILCDAPAVIVGVFIPDDSARWGAKPRKQRLLVYGLCGRHPLPERSVMVEDVLARKLGVQGGGR